MRRRDPRVSRGVLAALKGAVVLVASCASHDPALAPSGDAERYVGDAPFRRAALEASLVSRDNAYAALRLAHYAGGDSRWDALPEWNPRTEPVTGGDVDSGTAARVALGDHAEALAIDGALEGDDAMRALGERAFFLYPAQLLPSARVALISRDAAAKYGVWIDDARGVGGLVRAQMGDGSAALAMTCATCHVAVGANGVVVGVGSDRFDLGRILHDASGDPSTSSPLLAWGRGRVDVTTNEGTAPERIPDLRPTRWLTHLHQEATLVQRDRVSLAIRLETLIITSHGQALRPPRAVAWALATYLWSLADALPSPEPTSDAATRGQRVFASDCAGCHAPPALTGRPIAIDVVGTDPAIGLSPDRGTGFYRVPSLRGVGTRGLLLHDASVPGLEAMFDPLRTQPGFTGGTRGVGAIAGHTYGLDRSDADRRDLIAYLRGL